MAASGSGVSGSAARETFIRFRLNHIDIVTNEKTQHTQFDSRVSPFYKPGDGLRAVPEIRIFGATDRGQRVVAHVHGAFPYVYIEYKGELDPESVNSYIVRLGRALNLALGLSFPHRNFDSTVKMPQFVAFIVACKGIPFYGFHVGYKTFLKIYVVDPKHSKRVADVLRSGSLMGNTAFEVFEDHVNFTLQFMLDQNLFGCGWVEVSDCLFRGPLPDHIAAAKDDFDEPSCTGAFSSRIYDTMTVPSSHLHPSDGPKKVSHCPLELDLSVASILNRHAITPRNIHHDFTEYVHPSSRTDEKLVHSVKELWDDERRRREACGEPGPENVTGDLSQREWDTRAPGAPIWKTEELLREKLAKLTAEDGKKYHAQPGFASREPEFATFVTEEAKARSVRLEHLEHIRTTFEQVNATYPDRLELDQRETYALSAWAIKGIGFEAAVSPEKSARAKGKERASPDADEDFNEAAWREAAAAGAKSAEAAENSDDEQFEQYAYEGPPVTQEEAKAREKARAQQRLEKQEKVAREEAGDEEGELDLEASDEFEDAIGDLGGESVIQDAKSVAEVEDEDDEPTAKRVKREEPDVTQIIPWSPSASPEPSPDVRKRNPFASPDKKVRVRFAADMPPNPDSLSDGNDAAPVLVPLLDVVGGQPSTLSPLSPSLELPPPQVAATFDDFDDLPSDAFDYEPTPTVRDPGPDILPAYLRTGYTSDAAPESSRASSVSDVAAYPRSTSTSSEGSTTQDQALPAPVDSGSSSAPPQLFSSSSAPPPPSTNQPIGTRLASSTSPQSLPKQMSTQTLSPNAYSWAEPPPTGRELMDTIEGFGFARVPYRGPFYGDPKDVPPRAKDYGGRTFNIKGDTIKYLPAFKHWGSAAAVPAKNSAVASARKLTSLKWEWTSVPPSWAETESWLKDEKSSGLAKTLYDWAAPQIEGPTQVNDGFKFVPVKGAQSHQEKQHFALLTMELQVSTRGSLLPDPKHDPITALFYCFQSENEDIVPNGRGDDRLVGAIAVGDQDLARRVGKTSYHLEVVDTEMELINVFLDKIRVDWDPEVVGGYEVHNGSWGFLIQRAQAAYNWQIADDLGRVSGEGTGRMGTKENDRWGFNESSTLRFTGRHVLSIWRVVKVDNKLLQNSFEHVAFHILRQRTPKFSFETLTAWWNTKVPHQVARVFAYWINRVEMDVELLEEAEVISQTSESARVFGIDFKSVRERGSQFKVEAVMFRIAKPESFLLLSPTRQEVGRQNAAECQPLVMEPKSAFYKSPVVVLDFQSLYPSVMIAYNYCYSTCMGRIGTFQGTSKLGTTTFDPPPGLQALLQNDLNISPNGFAFVKPNIRKSLLAKMLSELLDSRVMVKSGMKAADGDKALLRLLNGRQMALKLLANVTYGYTSATFSGRMPCVEIADAIVQTGRETLERALETVRTTREWGAEVVYGDTDSLFISLPGKSKADAFRIGQEIADKVTSQNPRPIKLKFEKVYLPCVLLAKKRYVGFSYETEKVIEPAFDAKGIETVRRDGILATQKMQEMSLKILFRTADLSQVKAYCQRQWSKLIAGDVSPQDFTYAKAVKLGTYSTKGKPPPGAVVATRRMLKDPRAEPSYGERVPYVLFQAETKTLQVDRAIRPEDFVADSRLRLDTEHYITRAIIPPLERIFNLLGADVNSWYTETPKVNRLVVSGGESESGHKALMDEHFLTDRCVACKGPDGDGGLCPSCLNSPSDVAYALVARTREVHVRRQAAHAICASCEGTPHGDPVACVSFDCPTLYRRIQTDQEVGRIEALAELVEKLGQ